MTTNALRLMVGLTGDNLTITSNNVGLGTLGTSTTVDCKLVDQLQVQNAKLLNHRSKQFTHEFHYLIS